MPVCIIVQDGGTIPAIIMEDTESAMLGALAGVQASPPLKDTAAARRWLAGLPEPSGWFEDIDAALAAANRMRDNERAGGEEVERAREALGLSRADFAQAIGYGGNSNTRHKTMFEVENGQKTLSPQATRAMRGLLAARGLETAG